MLAAVKQFFEFIQNQNFQEAYQSTSEEFQKSASFQDFQNFLNTTGLINFQSAVWDEPQRDPATGMGGIRGTITSKDGGQYPIVIFGETKDNGQTWKIVNITPAASVPTPASPSPEIPELPVLIATVKKYLSLFVTAIQQNDFTSFHQAIATIWNVESTPEKLRDIFQEFSNKKFDLNFVHTAQPIFSAKPIIDQRGFLELHGYFPSKERNLVFSLLLTYEHPDWKLISIDVSSAALKS